MGFWAQISLGDKRVNPFSLTQEGKKAADKDKLKCRSVEREIEEIHARWLLLPLQKLVSGLSLQCEAVGSRGTLEEFGIAFEGNGRRNPPKFPVPWDPHL